MPKYPKNQKGKQPLSPRRGSDGRWPRLPPEPDPPDDREEKSSADEAPVTMGGLVIREPSPRPRRAAVQRPESPAGVRVSSQTGAIALSPASDNRKPELERTRPHPSSSHASLPTSNEHPKPKRQVTVETGTDEYVRPPKPPSPSIRRALHESVRGVSPESEQRDSILGKPAAHSSAKHGLREETQFHSVTSVTHRWKSSRNTQSNQRVMREHADRAEVYAQSAYEQSRAALDLISKSMDNVRSAFIEAKRARDRFHDLLSVSSRSRQNARRHAEVAPSRYLRGQVLDSEERPEAQHSVVSTTKLTPMGAPHDMGAHRMRVREWETGQREITPLRPAPEEPDRLTRQRAAPPTARADKVLAWYNLTSTDPSAPQRTAGEWVSWLDRRDHSKRNRSSQRAQTSSHGNESHSTSARPHGEGQSKSAQIRSTPKPNSKTKPATLHGQKTDTKKVSCFICGGDHYAKDCPPENRKAARGYTVRISSEDAPELLNDADSERQSNASTPHGGNAQAPEPDTRVRTMVATICCWRASNMTQMRS